MSINFVENNKKMTDSELVERINKGDYELLQVIIERYYPLICSYVRKLCPEAYSEDAFQEATLALYSAVKGFEPDKSAFSTFAEICIKRAVIGVLRSSNRKKAIPDELVSSIEDCELVDSNSPEKIFFDREDYKNLTDSIKLELSPLEYEVLQHYLTGSSYLEIALKLNISEKSVNNALMRIRKKLKK